MNEHISKKEIQHLSWLSKIKLSENEVEELAPQLNRILNYFDELQKIDTENVPATYHVMELTNVFRKDEVVSSSPDIILQAPNRRGRFIAAPKII
jgi:aspartyl-tRNA(Asn)/glutamyl-tRNA(Gln) amidotransferase subunit C